MRRHHRETLDSTNDEARRILAEQAGEDPLLVTADEQTSGRGTSGRVWRSPRGAGVYLSLALPRRPEHHAPTTLYTIAAGVACAEAVATSVGVEVQLKGVNDLVVSAGKVGGILTEAHVEGGGLTAVIIGVGINVLPAPRPVASDALPAACLADLVRPEVGRALLIDLVTEATVGRLLAWIPRVERGEDDAIRDAWMARCAPGSAAPW